MFAVENWDGSGRNDLKLSGQNWRGGSIELLLHASEGGAGSI